MTVTVPGLAVTVTVPVTPSPSQCGQPAGEVNMISGRGHRDSAAFPGRRRGPGLRQPRPPAGRRVPARLRPPAVRQGTDWPGHGARCPGWGPRLSQAEPEPGP